MQIHKFIEGKKPIMVLIHGILTPWQIWMPQIMAFKEKYNIYAVALNSHTEESASEFISAAAEAEEMEEYFRKQNIETIDVLCGLSLGGKISYEIWKNGKLNIGNLILDGAPLVSCPKIAKRIMINNYKKIIHQSKVREEKVLESFKKQFLPEKYLESYLKIADFMTDKSMENLVCAAFNGSICKDVNNHSRILFIHGTRGNEILSKKAAKLMKKYYPETEVVCFKGDAHCYKAIYEPEKWIEVVDAFLKETMAVRSTFSYSHHTKKK